MKILATTDLSRAGNDCYIYESVSIVEQFGIYSIIVCQKVTGWAKRETAYVELTSSDYNKIIDKYNKLCN